MNNIPHISAIDNLNNLINQFIEYKQIQDKLSSNSLKAYKTDLKHLTEHIIANQYIESLHKIKTVDILIWLKESYNSRARQRKAVNIRQFFLYIDNNHIFSIDKAWNMPLSSAELTPENPYIPADLEYHTVYNFAHSIKNQYIQILLLIILETGIQLEDLLKLTWQDINLYNKPSLAIITNHQQRLIPISIGIKNLFINLKEEFNIQSQTDNLIFIKPSKTQESFSPSYISNYINKLFFKQYNQSISISNIQGLAYQQLLNTCNISEALYITGYKSPSSLMNTSLTDNISIQHLQELHSKAFVIIKQ